MNHEKGLTASAAIATTLSTTAVHTVTALDTAIAATSALIVTKANRPKMYNEHKGQPFKDIDSSRTKTCLAQLPQ